ncbi:MAG: ATP-binding cassette domain-containing protein [Deltaproteobacteria bacterium]|nr:MAG: ATP-binding cassette domain-containing protein [Deltaproteobacteria bacterium]
MLELNGVGAGYGKMIILHNISLQCKDGEIVLILGPNGAGKTTLMRTIYRFADLHQGDMRYNGVDLSKCSSHDMIALGIGYIWQRDGFFPSMTVHDNLKMALYSQKQKDYEISERLDKVFSFFPRLKQKLGQTAITLSGGEKKMLAIACVLAQDHDLLLADELSEGLQPLLRDQSIDIITDWAREENKSVIFVEEAAEKALGAADRIYCLRDGSIVAEGLAQDFLDKTILEKLYFGEA